ncbi:MAG TPA: hypothetical protein VNO30_19520 [Kofleriaceae bacterium]|nr:hypothetical protein [Kofleriaceae bacterium]
MKVTTFDPSRDLIIVPGRGARVSSGTWAVENVELDELEYTSKALPGAPLVRLPRVSILL